LIDDVKKIALIGEFTGRINLMMQYKRISNVYLDPLAYPLALDMLARKALDVKGL